MTLASALARGYLARRQVAELRTANEEKAYSDPKKDILRRHVAKVSAASRVVASSLIANAAVIKKKRKSDLVEAVAMVRGVIGILKFTHCKMDAEGTLITAVAFWRGRRRRNSRTGATVGPAFLLCSNSCVAFLMK